MPTYFVKKNWALNKGLLCWLILTLNELLDVHVNHQIINLVTNCHHHNTVSSTNTFISNVKLFIHVFVYTMPCVRVMRFYSTLKKTWLLSLRTRYKAYLIVYFSELSSCCVEYFSLTLCIDETGLCPR